MVAKECVVRVRKTNDGPAQVLNKAIKIYLDLAVCSMQPEDCNADSNVSFTGPAMLNGYAYSPIYILDHCFLSEAQSG